MTRPDALRDYQIHYYRRFHDDTFLLYTDHALFTTWLKQLRRLANCFRILVEKVSIRGVTFLDLAIYMRFGRFEIGPKPPKDGMMPLAPTSAHIESIHRSRPTAIVRGLGARFDCMATARRAKHTFIDALNCSYAHNYTLKLAGSILITPPGISIPRNVYDHSNT